MSQARNQRESWWQAEVEFQRTTLRYIPKERGILGVYWLWKVFWQNLVCQSSLQATKSTLFKDILSNWYNHICKSHFQIFSEGRIFYPMTTPSWGAARLCSLVISLLSLHKRYSDEKWCGWHLLVYIWFIFIQSRVEVAATSNQYTSRELVFEMQHPDKGGRDESGYTRILGGKLPPAAIVSCYMDACPTDVGVTNDKRLAYMSHTNVIHDKALRTYIKLYLLTKNYQLYVNVKVALFRSLIRPITC
jgi:hypothetical protein